MDVICFGEVCAGLLEDELRLFYEEEGKGRG